MNEPAKVGHNNPPDIIEDAASLAEEANNWLTNHPVILSEDEAREGKLWVDRMSNTSKDMEVELRRTIEPLTKKIGEISLRYIAPRNALKNTYKLLLERIADFLKKEKARREKIATEAAAKAAEAEQHARAAEAVEKEAIADAAAGAISDVGKATSDADRAFEVYKKADIVSARAAKEVNPRIGGGIKRALGLRKKESLHITNAISAIEDMGVSDKLAEAIKTAARVFEKQHGRYPVGIKPVITEGL